MTLVQKTPVQKTLVQKQHRPASACAARGTVTEGVDAAVPQVWDDMSVEVALAVLAAARTGRLAVCDQDGQCTALVTRADLIAVCGSSAYSDRVRLRDVLGDHGFLQRGSVLGTLALSR